jgi:hypothetical protein
MSKSFKKIFTILSVVLAVGAAKCATVFPIATNPAVVNFGGGVSFDGTNYFVAFLSGTNIVSQRVSGTNGSLLGSPIVVGSNPGFPPAIAGTLGKTNYLMVWSDKSVSGEVDMFGQFISKSGATVGSKFNLLSTTDYNSNGYGFQTVEALASDGTNFLVVWQDQNSANFYGQLVTPSGTLSNAEFLISSQQQNGNSAAATFGKTNYIVVWQSNNNTTGLDNKTYAEFVSRSGVQGIPFQINQTDSTDQNPLTVAFDGTNYLVAWDWDSGSGSGTVANWDIYGRLVSQTGTFPGNELLLVADSGSQVLPALAFDGSNYLMAWGDGSFNTTNPTVRFQFFNRSGSASGSEFTVFTAQGTNNPLFTYNGLIFDGTRFVAAATLGTVSTNSSGDVNGFPSGEIFGAFIPSSTALQLTATSLPNGTTTVPYSQTLTASGGQSPYTWTLVSNSLPAGLSLSSGGVISGTPTTAGTTNFIVQVKDNTNAIATQALSLTIDTLDTSVVFTVTPAAISNTYNGTITLQITSLNNGEKVLVQKFLDVNTNGVVDANDLLVQQFNLKDGQTFVIGGATNYNVPGDGSAATGTISATLNFQTDDFIQKTIGQYAFRLSSPTAHFAAITNLFNVTNLPYAQKITGNVVSAGSNVTNAVVILFPPPSAGHNGLGNPVASAVANNSGAYSIAMPAGSYTPVAFKSNYVAKTSSSPTVTLTNGSTVTTNLTLTNATASISGQVVDSTNSSIGLPGLFVPLQSNDGQLASGFTDTNGNFTERVTTNQWSAGYSSGLPAYGYVPFADNYISSIDTTTGSVSGLTVSFAKANALFYGSVKDNLGNPVTGIDIEASDTSGNGTYSVDGYADQNGNYYDAVLGGLSGDVWDIQVGNGFNPNSTNYVFAVPPTAQNPGTNISAGQAIQINVVAIIATNHITGHVQDNFGNPIIGVGLFGSATIGGIGYFPLKVDTDTNGNYAMNVPNATWTVTIDNGNNGGSGDGNDSLSSNYIPPPGENLTIANNNGILNFTVQTNINVGGTLTVTTTSLPNGTVGAAYSQELTADGGQSPYSWSQLSGSLPSGLSMDSNGFISGTPATNGTFNFTAQVTDSNSSSATKSLSLTISSGILQVATTSLPNDTINVAYSQQLNASGGQPPYTWTNISGALPPGLTLATNGFISGTPTVAGTSNFTVRVKDSLSATATQALSLTINPLATNVNFYFTPAGVSNTYNGTVTLMVTGLVANETVTFQKYADINSNGVIDSSDILEQQFQLTDGQASVFSGVTNFNVPNDVDSVTGQITSPLVFAGVDNAQGFIGRHLYRLTSPTGHFGPITNAFTVTNFPFAQSISGNVVNSGTNVPYAIVLLLTPSGNNNLNLQFGTVANSSGAYSIKASPGTYQLIAVKSNFVADFSAAPTITLGTGVATNVNLTLTNATQTISGRVADLNNTNIGISLLGQLSSTNNLITLGFYDTNGNFTARVTGSKWKISSDTDGLKFYGYVGFQNSVKVDTTTGSVSSVSILVPKATAIIYGAVKDTFGNPVVGVHVFSQDQNQYEGEAVTDPSGNYIAGALGGETWSVQVDNDQNPTVANYVYSQALNQNGGTNISLGQAVLYNFTAISATNQITGFVRDNSGNPLTNIQIYASAQIGSTNFQAIAALTDTNGNYSINVSSGTWFVSVSAQNCNNSGDSSTSLGTNYQCPNSVSVTIANNNGLANFTVQTNFTGTLQVTTTSLPGGSVGAAYSRELTASGGLPPYAWSQISGSLPSGLALDSGGFISGTTTASGTFNFTAQVTDMNSTTATKALLLFIQGRPSIASISKISGGQFQFAFSGITNQNYTVQVSTNLIAGGWVSLFTTNSTTSTSFNVADPGATNQQRFYRVLIGP